MARLEVTGIQGLMDDMRRMGQQSGEVARAMTLAAADETAKAWRATADAKGFRKTGAMIESVGFPEGAQIIGDTYYADIYPQGKDERGTRNAEKAFILHYGSSRIKPTYWVDEADKKAEENIALRIEGIWADFLETGRVPPMPDIQLKGKGKSGLKKQRG